ncbi:unnamed protein product [Caenorhabditis angaria]|uniref:Transcription factor AP-2 C-terminal domain-containing protein n=1 Tax=Caenorhabditis angaria TaxID=860376 RepID=A0A9P1I9R7_9PELO|nr:unnamed protein product [Caenorhabditis angaria]
MFNRRLLMCKSEDEYNRASQCGEEEEEEEEEDDDEDYEDEEEDLNPPPPQQRVSTNVPTVAQNQPPQQFYESVRTFVPSHMHISCHYDIPYPPHIIQPPVFTYSQQPFFSGQSNDEALQVQHQSSQYCQNLLKNEGKPDRAPFLFFNNDQQEIVGDIYCTVPGRTSLLSSTTKYRVTVAEIQRRISPPECLNASLLGGILRKAKSKDGGKTLRDSLKKLGLTLPAGRRKQANVTAWTALVEEEAIHMAKDFSTVCEKEFHSREIGIYLTKTGLGIDPDVVKRRNALENSRKVISELTDLLSCDRTPLTPYFPRNMVPLDPGVQQHLSHFTLMTHGFGNVAMGAVLESVKLMIDESIKYIDRCCQQQQWR